MKTIGVMQGRLLPKYMGRFQAHPVGYWKQEYAIARDLGLDSIEFIFDFHLYQSNPLFSTDGIKEIIDISYLTGVKTNSVCADFFMERPIFDYKDNIREQNREILENLILNCSLIGVTDIVIPCVDQSSITSKEKKKIFIKEIQKYIVKLEKYNINFSLETDLPPEEFSELMSHFNSNRIRINYDLGNSASLGYSFKEELDCYGDKISNIHIKDRPLNGPSVIIGEGDAKIHEFFKEIYKNKYDGLLIMQAYRDEEGLEIFKKQYKYVRKLINEK